MPIYVHPTLLTDESAALRKRRQGKSCYNFARSEPDLFAELDHLTATGFAAYQAAGMVNATATNA